MPTLSTDATIPAGQTIRLDTNAARVRRLFVEGTLLLGTGTLEANGNIIVRGSGRLTNVAGARALVRFLVPSESQFVGAGLVPLDSDVGLWVIDAGRVTLNGRAKLAWTRLAAAAAVGATSIDLAADPTGWEIGDEVLIAPTGSPVGDSLFYDRFDLRVIAGIVGRRVTFSAALSFAHPAVTVGSATYTAEVMNLTRDIRIEGRPGLRTHTWMRSSVSQQMNYVALRWMGPRLAESFVEGRWAVHFHLAGEAARGSVVDGTVVRDAGSWGFVAHGSHGVTFRNTIGYNFIDSIYKWDPIAAGPGQPVDRQHESNDILYQHAIGARLHQDRFASARASVFFLDSGARNTCDDCVAVGVSEFESSGAHWAEFINSPWTFRNYVGHNNNSPAIFNWKNDNFRAHPLENLVLYHNPATISSCCIDGGGIQHGAYKNGFRFTNVVAYISPLRLQAVSLTNPRQIWENLVLDGGGVTDYVVISQADNNVDPEVPILFRNLTARNFRRAAFYVQGPENGPERPIDIVAPCTFGGNEFLLDSTAHPRTEIRVSGCTGPRLSASQTLSIRPMSASAQPGDVVVPEWNARVRSIAPFASTSAIERLAQVFHRLHGWWGRTVSLSRNARAHHGSGPQGPADPPSDSDREPCERLCIKPFALGHAH